MPLEASIEQYVLTEYQPMELFTHTAGRLHSVEECRLQTRSLTGDR